MDEINRFIRDEVTRQGYAPGTEAHLFMCMNMARGWTWWEDVFTGSGVDRLDPELIEHLGRLVHPWLNEGGFRTVNVEIRGAVPPRVFPWWDAVPRLVKEWCEAVVEGRLDANEAYIQYEDIHPFGDGNGRTGKILFNWLRDPVTLSGMREPTLPKVPKEWRIP